MKTDEKTIRRLLVIPDVQAKPGVDFSYLHSIGEYWLAKQPEVVVCIGDFADMPSLSSYDKGKRSYEGSRYKNDIEAAATAMKILLNPIRKHNLSQVKNGLPVYRPRMVLTMGNHEERIDRATQLDPLLFGTISTEDLKYRSFGWDVHKFLDVVVINEVAFSHYFASGALGRPCGSAQQQLTKLHMSCIAGHQQGRQTATGRRADGRTLTSIIAGSAYPFDMDYLGAQGNNHFRGVVMLHNVTEGAFDEVYVSLRYLMDKYPSGKRMMFSPSTK